MSDATRTRGPATRLTQGEVDSFQEILGDLDAAAAKSRLRKDLLAAIHVELATIPIYLYTYYSIARKPPQDPWTKLPDVNLYAGKAGALIMSVAVEEMLHMSLSSNIYYALYGNPPELYGNSPSSFPTTLPHHKKLGPVGPNGYREPVTIPLSKFSYDQLWNFLVIEYPEKPSDQPTDRNWSSLSQFYQYIEFLMSSLSDDDFTCGAREYQIQPYNYSPNNIDTVRAKGAFDPWGIPPGQPPHGSAEKTSAENKPYASASAAAEYADAPDSHSQETDTALITVGCHQDAIDAITTISEEGEGADATKWDDPSQKESSHFFKFLTLQAQLERYKQPRKEQLPNWGGLDPPDPIPPTITDEELYKPIDEGGVIYDFPDNPTTADYRGDSYAQAMSNFCNGIYQYMLIMTETIFKVPDPGQKIFFNQGMHNSMIWMLDKVIQTMRRHTITKGKHRGKVLGPTFENIDLGPRAAAHGNLVELAKAAAAASNEDYLVGQAEALPPVGVYWGKE